MILGRVQEQNWMQKLLKINTKIKYDVDNDNLLILDNQENDSCILSCLTSSKPIVFITIKPEKNTLSRDQLNTVISKYHKKPLYIDLSSIDTHKIPLDRFEDLEYVLESISLKLHEVFDCDFIYFYNSTLSNSQIFFDIFYSKFIKYFISQFQSFKNERVLVALENVNEDHKLQSHLTDLVVNKKIKLVSSFEIDNVGIISKNYSNIFNNILLRDNACSQKYILTNIFFNHIKYEFNEIINSFSSFNIKDRNKFVFISRYYNGTDKTMSTKECSKLTEFNLADI